MTEVAVTLDPDERSPALARRVVRQCLAGAHLDHLLDDVLLLVTELVTNAAVHAGTAFQLELHAQPPGLRVEVTDHSPGAFPVLRPHADEEREGGRGLFLMDALATRWGTTHFATGKSVWFELDRPLPQLAAAPAPPVLGELDASLDVDWLLGLPAHLERQLASGRLQGELVHRLGDALGADDVWLAATQASSAAWSLAAVRGVSPDADELEAQRRAVLAATEPVLRQDGDLIVVVSSPDGTVGLLGVRGAADLDPPRVAVARLVAQRLGLSVGDAKAVSDRARERGSLALLAEASDMFAGQLDVQLAAALAAQLVVPRFALWSAVYTTLEGPPRLAAVAHADEEQLDPLRRGLGGADGLGLAREVLAKLEPHAPVFLAPHELPGEVAAGTAGQVLAVPLVARRRLIGALLVVRPADDAYVAQDVGVLLDLARRAALAVDNARLYQERTAVAQALQAWLLPPALPTAAEMDVGARYVAAGANDVGGDFYDVFPLPDGGWGVAIGDVCGKGAEAAAITGQARDVLRLLLRRGSSPAQALRELNDAILELGERGRFCTAAAATVHADGEALSVCLSVAGHPAPVRVGAGTSELVGATGSLLGVMPDVDLEDESLRLAAGESLVFYTDGVTERRRGALMLGEEGLLRILRRAHGLPADAVAGLVEREVTAFAREPSRDDLALLVVRATGAAPA